MMRRIIHLLAVATAFCSAALAHGAPPRVLRVCADPNNLPFSNREQQGFENKLAELLARTIGASLEYTWWPQRRGFIRNTLNAGRCDLVMGVPRDYELALTTRPYYRSTYVFVTRRRDSLAVRSFDDPRLRELTVGVHVIGDDYANTPPAHALARRGLIRNVVGYTIYGDYSEPNPPAALVRAVAEGSIDVAVAWGPLAGFVARDAPELLRVTPVVPRLDGSLPLAFDISLGVRKGDVARKRELERALVRKRAEIRALLDAYGVPRA